MRLFIDGDAFPNKLKGIVSRAVERLKIPTMVIANKHVYLGESEYINYIVVSEGADVADDRIVEMIEAGDLVITADIPLADRIISKNAHAIDHRGGLFCDANIKGYLAMRDLMQDIRDSGEYTKGPAPFSQRDAHNFANQLDSFLNKHFKG